MAPLPAGDCSGALSASTLGGLAGKYVLVVAGAVLGFDPIAEARRRWLLQWPGAAEHMAAITSIMRVHQLVLAAVERALQPFGLTFASYEALRLLAFSRSGALPLGKMGERLMVHPASITNTIDRLEEAGLVTRMAVDADRRRKLASITGEGRRIVGEATVVLNRSRFGLGALSESEAAELSALLRKVRAAAGDFAAGAADPWREV